MDLFIAQPNAVNIKEFVHGLHGFYLKIIIILVLIRENQCNPWIKVFNIFANRPGDPCLPQVRHRGGNNKVFGYNNIIYKNFIIPGILLISHCLTDKKGQIDQIHGRFADYPRNSQGQHLPF
jgi:hypothetical protein